jgi:CHAD domain-containing protein
MVQEAGNRLISTLQKQAERIIYFCSAENVSPNLAVHEFRKSFKRLRALLFFYDEHPEEFPANYRNQIQKFCSFLAPLRESFVNIQIFERITTNNNFISDRKLKAAKDSLAEKNKTLIESEFLGENGCETIQTFIKIFDLHPEIFGPGIPSMKQLMNQLSVSFLKSYSIHQRLTPLSEANEWHQLRKKLKRLWYQLDFVKFLHPRYFKLKSDQLNKITEQLGEDHDLQVFLDELKSGYLGFDVDELQILENQVEHLRELNRIKLLPQLKQFFNEPPEMFNQKMEKIFKFP